MDEYTLKTKEWLDQRFKSSDENGMYKSHAPIYGFNKDYIYLGLYKNNYSILKEIQKLNSRYKIEAFLEVGCAEGYTANLVREIFGFKVTVCDLSSEAVKRAKEIYGLDGFMADVQCLDNIKDNSYDLVLCSETIEHVPLPEKAVSELIRITKKVLIITVPAAKNLVEKKGYVPPKEPHTHLNIFTKEDLKRNIYNKKVGTISNRMLSNIEYLCLNKNGIESGHKPKWLIEVYKMVRILLSPVKKIYGIKLAKILIKLDYLLCNIFPYDANTYIAVYGKVVSDYKNRLYINKKNIIDYMLNKLSNYSPLRSALAEHGKNIL